MKKIILNRFIISCIIIASFAICNSIKAQWKCSFQPSSNDYNVTKGNGACNDWTNYAPFPNVNTVPIKTIRIAIHIIQDENGNNNLQNTPAHINYLNQIIGDINWRLANMDMLNLNVSSPFLTDSRIRILLDAIYFHPDNENLWDATTDPENEKLRQAYYKYIVNNTSLNDIQKNHTLNVIVGGGNSSPVGGRASGIGDSKYILVSGWDYNYCCHLYHPYHWGVAMHLVHEIGHSCGLYHNFHGGPYGSQCDDIADNDPPSLPCPIEGTSNNIMDYHPGGGGGFSQLQIGKMHYFLSGNVGSISNDVIKDCNVTTTTIIGNNQQVIWAMLNEMPGDIIINPNSSLTIKCTIKMHQAAKIIVEPGAKLILDGGTITSACEGEMWQGIEVWGNSNQQQESSFWDPNQGIVKIINGTIENADNAITLWHPGDWSSMGGIVDANGATFLNNHRSVEFMKYQNKAPNGNTYRNESSFNNCTFKVDDNYRGGSNNPFSSHVTLWDVNGVNFTTCRFLNEQSNKEYSLSNNKAIYSLDAGFTVNGTCKDVLQYGQPCPSEDLVKSEFKGFNTAIHAKASSTLNIVKVQDAVFNENVKGVQYDGINNSWVNRSEFFVGNNSIANYPYPHEGIFTIGATGYRIEENTLQPSEIPVSNNYGIRIRNSNTNGGGDNNQIYKNITKGLSKAELAEGTNKNTTEIYKGLQILCNRHDENINDITASALTLQGQMNGIEGIRLFQGNSSTPTISAGNLFSHNGNDIENNTNSPIIYYHTGGQTEPLDYTSLVFPTVADNANTCPSYSYGYASLSAVTKAQLSSDYSGKEATYINLLYNYNSLIDGGNTNALLHEIEMSWSQDAWDLRAKLIDASPYLSGEVLREVAMKDVLPQAMLLEICLANPDGTRNKEFIDFLGEKIPNPLPQYMLDLIVANWDAKTARTLLEGSLADVSSQMAVISDLLISNSMLDSIPNKDEARGWLIRRGNISDYYSVAESYIESNNFDNALNYVNQIPDLFKLSKEQEAEHLNFKNYAEFRSSIAESGNNIMQLKDTDIEILQQIANNNTGRSSVLAQNILCFGYQLCVDYLPADGKGEQLKSTKLEKTAKEVINAAYNKITATPNPANVYVAFTWELPLLKGNAELIITDINGKSITQKTITTKRGQWIWDTRTIKKGIYLYEIKTDNERLGNGKIVINN